MSSMLLSEADRERLGTPHPELLAALAKAPYPDFTAGNPNATIHTLRSNRSAHFARLRHLHPIPGPIPSQVRETIHRIPVRDVSTLPIKIYTPTSPPSSPPPLVILFHEGGRTLGDLEDEDTNCRLLARDLGLVCVNVAYRLAPEHPFPTGVHDAYDAVEWCARNAPSSVLAADPRRAGFIVGGSSAGGNYAAVVCQLARDSRLDPPITGQWLCVPALLSEAVVPGKWKGEEYRSRFESRLDPVLRIDTAREWTGEKLEMVRDPLYSPLLHENLKDLPPAFFQVAGLDPFRDEALIYERVLREESGVRTMVEVYEGVGHMFWTNWPTMQRSRDFWRDLVDGMRWLIEGGHRRRLG